MPAPRSASPAAAFQISRRISHLPQSVAVWLASLEDARRSSDLRSTGKAFVRSSLKLGAFAEAPGRGDGAVGGSVTQALEQPLAGVDPVLGQLVGVVLGLGDLGDRSREPVIRHLDATRTADQRILGPARLDRED